MMDGKQGTVKPLFRARGFRRARLLLPGFALVLAASCVNDDGGEAPAPVGSKTIHGGLRVTIVEALPPYWERHTEVSGRFYDASSPDPVDWQEQAASGSCRVLKPAAPFCDPGCGSSGLCSAEGFCVPFPNPMHVGAITVRGIKTAAGANVFVMNPELNAYRPSGLSFASPPYAEGDVVTFTATGSADAPAFSVSGRAPHLPTLLNDSIVLDGSPIILRWTPPGPGAGPSVFLAGIDISHHGGIKGIIECAGEDDGEMEIAGSLVNELKALGVSGFPQLDVVRRTTSVVEGHNLSLVLEARLLKYLAIPGLISCREDEDCPGNQSCQDDYKCQ